MRIGEGDLDAGSLGPFLVTGHFLAAIIGHRESLLLVDAAEHSAEAIERGVGAAAIQLNQHSEQRRALDQRAHRRAIVLALDGVALPVAGHEAHERSTPYDWPRPAPHRPGSEYGCACALRG